MNNPHAHDAHAGKVVEDGEIAGDKLLRFIERVERLTEEGKAINASKSDVFQEAQSDGFDKKIMKQIIKDRAKDSHTLEEEEALLYLYKQAIGMLQMVEK